MSDAEQWRNGHFALAGYHLSPEAKFENGRPFDQGPTGRRRVRAYGFVYIGKEANRWEEAFFLGPDPEAEVGYGSAPDGQRQLVEELQRAKAAVGERRLADALGIARATLRTLVADEGVARGTAALGDRSEAPSALGPAVERAREAR